jgi:hypothetical protein
VELIMGLLSKSAILDNDDLKFEDVPVPQWGGSVRVRVMTGAERDAFREAIAAQGGDVAVGKFSATLLAFTCIDETGQRLFTLEDVEALRAKSASSLDTPATIAMRLNGLGGGAVEDATKNSSSGQSGDSGSASPKS